MRTPRKIEGIGKTLWCCIVLTGMLAGMTERATAQQSEISDPSAFRSQLLVLADAVVDSAGITGQSSVELSVDGSERRTSIENAFLETLQKRGAKAGLVRSDSGFVGTVLRISDVMFRRISGDEDVYATELDARVEGPSGREARYLGHFTRESAVGQSSGHESTLARILEPLAVISGTILIVYLFFTVRS